jgi:hypothetical protein
LSCEGRQEQSRRPFAFCRKRGLLRLGTVGIIAATVLAIVWSGLQPSDDKPVKAADVRLLLTEEIRREGATC